MLELTTVRLTLREFWEYWFLHEKEVVKLYTENVVAMYVVNQLMSIWPAIMAELRRQHQFCKCHGLILDCITFRRR
jgi:hypothetical protein